MKFASLEAKLDGSWGLLVYHILLFSLPLSGSIPDITEILLTWTLSHNSSGSALFENGILFQNLNKIEIYHPTTLLEKSTRNH